ncbi:unnamed protein product [Durusdinium trenchii]|uniref:ABC1 atypical kinase-like domain-containing protein n=1 Tax=Durusdinium trenchii TaxID=1381693 RepID=A0ABP0KK69_9DINO
MSRGHGFLLFAVFTALIFRPFDDWTFAFTGTWSRSSVSPSVSLRFNDASKDRLPTSHSESNSKLELRPFEVEHLQKDEKDPETESDHFFIPSDYDDLPRRFDRELLLNFFSSKPTEIAWRWSEIVQELWPTWDLWHREERLQKKKRTRGAKLRTALSRLGPVFVKIGQTLSERPDLIGDEAAEELKLLQQENVEFSTELAFATILEDLNHTGVLSAEMPHAYRHDPNGAPLFQSISHRPVAAASLGQVYKATTLDGRTVAVKVQRPGSLKQVALDWTCWALGLGVMDLYWGGQGDEYPKIADEVAEGVFKELDYHNEARNAELFLKKHRFLPFVTAPQWVPELTGPKGTARVLTLEWINGRKLQEIESEEERMKMACVSSLVFTGFVHADPHAGNLILTEDGRLAFLDFGLMGTVEPHVMEGFAAGIQHLLAERWLLLAKVMQDVGFMAVGETGGFKKVIDPTARIFEYTSCPDEEFAEALEKSMKEEEGGLSRFGALATALTKLSNNYHMVMPGYIILFIRTFLTLEGIAGVVRPDFNIYEASLPYAMQRALSPKTKAAVEALRENFITESGAPQWDTFDTLIGSSDSSNSTAATGSSSSSSSSSVSYGEILQRVLGSPEGFALRRIFADLDANQALQGLAGPRGEVASEALAEELRSPWRLVKRSAQALRQRLRRVPTRKARPVPTAVDTVRSARREKCLKTIGALQLQKFNGRTAAVAALASMSIFLRISFWALVKAFRFSTKRFSNAGPL